MAEYKGYSHRSTFTIANLTEVGSVSLDDMGSLPFFSLSYKGKELPIKSEKYCAETNNDCFQYASKYLDIKWIGAVETHDSWIENKFESR